jgi:hypothetical protein
LILPTHMLRNDIQKREHDAKLMLYDWSVLDSVNK